MATNRTGLGTRSTSLGASSQPTDDSLYDPSLDAWSSSSWDTNADASSSSGEEEEEEENIPQQHPSSTPRRLRSLGLSAHPSLPSPREAARTRNHPLHFAFAQAFGERTVDMPPAAPIQEADMISAVQFNHDSELLATGDKGGRIVILRRTHRDEPSNIRKQMRTRRRRSAGPAAPSHPDNHDHENPDVRYDMPVEAPKYRFWTQFQSHEPEFDYLKSMEVDEKINQIRWCRHSSGSSHLIATNDKTIKLWRIQNRNMKRVITMDPESLLRPKDRNTGFAYGSPPSPQSPQSAALRSGGSSDSGNGAQRRRPRVPYSRADYYLQLPALTPKGPNVVASPRRLFSNAHSYHINSISLNSDEETFLSSDDLRVNMWSLAAGGVGFNVLDIKPGNMEDLTEVITSAAFHPYSCHLFLHSTSRGSVKVFDMRRSALCHSWARTFQEPEETSSRSSFFSEIIASISDAKFSPCGRYIMTRDYMNLRLWDMNMENRPVLVVPVHEHLRARLCDLYENDCIFDKFQCAFSNDGGSMLTGSYNSLFQSYSSYNGMGAAVEASVQYVSGLSGRHNYTAEGLSETLIARSSAEELVDPSRRIMHLHASPTEPFSAVAAGAALYLYYGAP